MTDTTNNDLTATADPANPASPAVAADATTASSPDALAASDATTPPKNPLAREQVFYLAKSVVDQKVDAAIIAQGKNTRMAGFRPGKVHKSVLYRKFGQAALTEVLQREALAELQKKLETDKESPAASPHVVPSTVAGEQGYEVKCHYEVLPTIDAPNFSGQVLTVPNIQVTEKEVGEMVEILREQRGEMTKRESGQVEAPDDFILLDFKTRLKDQEEHFEEGQDRRLRLNTKTLLPAIQEALKSAKVGEQMEVDMTLSPDYPQEAYRSKEAVMSIDVKAVETISKPDLDADFFSEFGVETEADFRQSVQEHLEREVKMRLSRITQQRALDKLLEATPQFPIPMAMLFREVQTLQQQSQPDKESPPPDFNALVAIAQRRVMLGLVLSAWQKRENIQVSDAELDSQIDEMVALQPDEAAAKAQIKAHPQQIEMVRLAVIEKKVGQWIRDNVESVKEEPIELSTLLESAA